MIKIDGKLLTKWVIRGKEVIKQVVNKKVVYEKQTGIAPGLYTDDTYTTFATLPNGNEGTWANIKLAYPQAFATAGQIVGAGLTSYFGIDFAGALVISNKITSVENSAFRDCTGLTGVFIPDSVTGIGIAVFEGCTNLISIIIPDSVTNILENAFQNCTGLTGLVIGNGVTSILNCAFYGCTGLTSITIPNSVTFIGSSAFENCTGLTSVTIGTGLARLDGDTFRECTRLTTINYNAVNCEDLMSNNEVFYNAGSTSGAITLNIGSQVTKIPARLFCPYGPPASTTYPRIETINWSSCPSGTTIGNAAFYGCTGLTSITIPAGVTNIGTYTFSASGLTSITIPESVTSIGEGVFKDCTGLTSITIPSSVTTIGNHAFSSCRALTSINIPSNVTSIGDFAFYACIGLRSIITIPNSVTSIGKDVFYMCVSLRTVNVYTTNSTNKINDSPTNAWFYECFGSLVIHASSTLNATTAKVAFGEYWNYRTSTTEHTVVYDL